MPALEPFRGDPERQIAIAQPARGEAPAKGDNIDIAGLFDAFRRRMGLFLIIMGAVMTLVLVFLFVYPVQYTATARVAVEDRAIAATPEKETPVVSQASTQQGATVATEAQIVQSVRVTERVVAMLHLDQDPEFNCSVQTLKGKLIQFLLRMCAPPTPTSLRDQVITTVLANLRPAQYLTTNAIDINYTDHNARKAQRIANAFAQAYLEDQVAAKYEQSRKASTGLLVHIEQMRQQADEDAAKVQAYKIAHNLLSVGEETLTEQEISSYNQAIAAEKAEAAGDLANLRTAQEQLAHGSNGEDVGEALSSPVVGALRAQRAVLSVKLADMEAHYGPKYPDLPQTRQQLADVDQEIRDEIRRTISNLVAKAAVSQKRLETMEATLAATKRTLAENNAAITGLENLTRAATVSQQIYEAYLDRSKESVAQASSLLPDAEIVSRATLPPFPSFPNTILFMALGVVAGMLFGCAGVLVAEMTEDRLITAEDVERRFGCRYLGGIPLLASVSGGRGPGGIPLLTLASTGRYLSAAGRYLKAIPFLALASGDRRASPIDAVVKEPSSAYSEAFRALRAAIGFSTTGPAPRVVLITSAFPEEGKTTVALGLARTSALQGVSTVVIDCDVRRRGLTRVLGLDEQRPGLLDVLAGRATLAEALVPDEASGAMVLPMSVGELSSNEVLGGEAMDKLLEVARTRFRIIVFDAAPVLAIAATRVLAAKADAVILAAHWRKTHEAPVRAALRLLPDDQVRLAGIVLTRIDVRQMSKYGRADAGRFFKKFKQYYA